MVPESLFFVKKAHMEQCKRTQSPQCCQALQVRYYWPRPILFTICNKCCMLIDSYICNSLRLRTKLWRDKNGGITYVEPKKWRIDSLALLGSNPDTYL